VKYAAEIEEGRDLLSGRDFHLEAHLIDSVLENVFGVPVSGPRVAGLAWVLQVVHKGVPQDSERVLQTFGTFPTVLDLAHTYIHTYIQLKTFIHLTNGVVSDS